MDKLHPNDLARRSGAKKGAGGDQRLDRERKIELLRRVLGLEEQLGESEGFVRFARENADVLELLTGFVTKDKTPYEEDNEALNRENGYDKPAELPLTRHPNDSAPEEQREALRIAFNAQALICGAPNQTTIGVLDKWVLTRPEDLLGPTFRAFRSRISAERCASVYHLCQLLNHAMKINPEGVVSFATKSYEWRISLLGMLHNLACPAVGDFLFRLFTNEDRRISVPTMKAFQKKLFSYKPLVTCVSLVAGAEPSSVSSRERAKEAANLVVNVLRHYLEAPIPSGEWTAGGEMPSSDGALLSPLLSHEVTSRLFETVMANPTAAEHAANVLATLAEIVGTQGKARVVKPFAAEGEDEDEKIATTADKTKTMAGKGGGKRGGGGGREERDNKKKPAEEEWRETRLVAFARDMKPFLEPYAGKLCKALEEELSATRQQQQSEGEGTQYPHTSYVVTRPFTHRRLQLVQALGSLVNTWQALRDCVPWEALVRWREDYPHNSLYQGEFARLFIKAAQIGSREEETREDNGALKQLVCDRRVVTLFVGRLELGAQGTDHAHLLRCCNALRLRALQFDQKRHWLPQYLKSHQGWNAFQPELLKRTSATLTPLIPTQYGNLAVPMPKHEEDSLFHDLVDPNNPLTGGVQADFARRESAQENVELGLGSRYARQLGFVNTGEATREGEVDEEEEEAEEDGEEEEEGGDGGGGKGAEGDKKTKKSGKAKKKKKKKR